MTQPIWADNALTTLASPISNTATSVTLLSGSGALFPSPTSQQVFSLTFISASNPNTYEIAYCTARSGDTCTITRGQEGTTALAWNAGDLAQNLVTAGLLNLIAGGHHKAVYQIVSGSQQVSLDNAAFTTVNATIFAAPPNGRASARGWGAGGGAGGCNLNGISGPGGGGGYFEVELTGLTTNTTIGVGAGGAGGAGTASGSAGGNTTVGGITANGGGGGGGESGAGFGTVGDGGTVTGVVAYNQFGSGGSSGYSTGSLYVAGLGGGSFGSGLNAPLVGNVAAIGSPGQFPGQGATSSIIASEGAAGANGQVIIEWES